MSLIIRGREIFVCLIFVDEWSPRNLIPHENFYVYGMIRIVCQAGSRNELQWAELITELTTVVLQAGLQLAVRRFSVLYVTKALGGNDSHDCRRLNHHHHARYTDS